MEKSQDIVLEGSDPSTFLSLAWQPGVPELLGQEKCQQLLLQAQPLPKQTMDEYHPPHFNPANIGLNWNGNDGMELELLECILFRRRDMYIASLLTPKSNTGTDSELPPLSSMEKRTQEGAAVFSPSNLDQELVDEETVYIGQSILLSLLASQQCPEALRASIADVFVLHTKTMIDTMMKLVPPAENHQAASWSPMLFISLLGGLLLLLEAPEPILSTRIALEMIPLLTRLQAAIVDCGVVAKSGAASALALPPMEKRKVDESYIRQTQPLKRQRTVYYRHGPSSDEGMNISFATAVQIMLDNVESTMAGSTSDIGLQHSYESSTAGLRAEDVDCVRMIMLYLNVSGQTAKQLLRSSASSNMILPSSVSSFAQVMLYVATHPSHLPLMQIEMEMECVKTSLSLLFELQMTITTVEVQEEPVQVLHEDVHQKLMRWKGAMSVLLSLGWTINTSGWYRLEFFKVPQGVPHLQEAKRMLTKYIGICEVRLKQLQDTHKYLFQQQQTRISKTETPELAFACPWTARTFLLAVDLIDHIAIIEPWLRAMVFSRVNKLFWQPPYGRGNFSATSFPSYSSCRHEVNASSAPQSPPAFWGLLLQHITYVESKLKVHLIQLPLPRNALTYDCLYVVPMTEEHTVDFQLAAVYPTETRLVHALSSPQSSTGPTVANSQLLHTLQDGTNNEWVAALIAQGATLLRKPTPEFERVERLVLSLALMVSEAMDAAFKMDMEDARLKAVVPLWNHFRKWLEQASQRQPTTLPNLTQWCLFLHQVWVGPRMALYTQEKSIDYVLNNLFTFLRDIAETILTLPLRQTVLMQRRILWLHLVGLHLFESNQSLPVMCQDLKLHILLEVFRAPSALQHITSKGWHNIVLQSPSWSIRDKRLLRCLWRQPIASIAPLTTNPCQEEAVKLLLAQTMSEDAWNTALTMIAACSPKNTSITPLTLAFLEESMDDRCKLQKACVLARLALVWLAYPIQTDWENKFVLPMLSKLSEWNVQTQHQVLHLLRIILPQTPPSNTVAEFLLLLAACQEEPHLPHPTLNGLESQQLYTDGSTSFLALDIIRHLAQTSAEWKQEFQRILDDSLQDFGASDMANTKKIMLQIGSLMLCSYNNPSYALFPGQTIKIACTKDLAPIIRSVEPSSGIMLSMMSDMDTCRVTCKTFFLSRSITAAYFTIESTIGIIGLANTLPTILPTNVENWVSLVEMHLEQLTLLTTSGLGLWFLQATFTLFELNLLDRDKWLPKLLTLAVTPEQIPIPIPHRMGHFNTLQPPNYWQAQLIYRRMATEVNRVMQIASLSTENVLSGLSMSSTSHDMETQESRMLWQHEEKDHTLSFESILTVPMLMRSANISSNPESTTEDMTKLLSMGWSASICSFVLQHYPNNVEGALQWLLNDGNAEDIQSLRLQGNLGIVPDRPAAPSRVRHEIKEAILAPFIESQHGDNPFHQSLPVLNALRQVPRECFVPPLYQNDVESDSVINHPLGYTVPSMVQCYQLITALDVKPGVTILDVGTGSGYFCTLLAHLYGDRIRLTTWEQDAHRLAYAYFHMAKSVQDGDVVRHPYFMNAIEFKVCDAFAPLEAMRDTTYDRVHIGASCPRESVHLLFSFVANHGIMVIPVDGTLYRIEKTSADWTQCRMLALGSVGIESLVAPSVERLAAITPHQKSTDQGLHAFQERANDEPPLILRWDVENPYISEEEKQHQRWWDRVLVRDMIVAVRPESDPMIQRGISEAGNTVVRLGGPKCQLRELSMGVKISDASLKVSNRGSFGTACANVAVRGGGRWFYEIRIGTSKVIQIGWVLPGFDPNPESGLGVGDDAFSYAYDGRRKKKWFCGRNEEYCKQMCKAGDVVGCLLDLDDGSMTFYLNGISLGVAFSGLERNIVHGGYSPACSMDGGESVWFNFGATPFLYPPPQSVSYCALTNFTYPPLLLTPALPVVRIQNIDASTSTVTVVDTTDGKIHVVPKSCIIPVDYPLTMWIPSNVISDHSSFTAAVQPLHPQLKHHESIACLRYWLFSTQRQEMNLQDQASLLEVTSEGRVFPQHLYFAQESGAMDAQDANWMRNKMTSQIQIRQASNMMVLEASRHPLSMRLVQVSANVSSCLKMIRTHLIDVDSQLDKGQTRQAFSLLQRITDIVLEKTNRESGDHLQRCRSSLDKVYQTIRTGDDGFHSDMSSSMGHFISMELSHRRSLRTFLQKTTELRKALQSFEELVAPSSIVPIESVHGKYVGIPAATSLLVEFDTRTTRSHWKLVFYADKECTRRLPWVLSRDGLRSFVIPSNYFYYSFVPDHAANMTAEWGYAFRVTPYRTSSPPTWAPWQFNYFAAMPNPSRFTAISVKSNALLNWVRAAISYCRIPGARLKEDIMAWLLNVLFCEGGQVDPSLDPVLREYLYCSLPELNMLFRESIRWHLHNNRFFQVLLQFCTSLLAHYPTYEPVSYSVDAFGYHAEMHEWHKDLVHAVEGFRQLHFENRVDVNVWEPEVASLYHSLRILKEALKQFEASIKSEVQRWHKDRRERWLRQVEQAYHPALLVPLVCVFNETLSATSRDSGWSSERNKWLRSIQAACTVGAVARQLLILAGCIDSDAHSPSWTCQSYDWRKAVVNLTKEPHHTDMLLPVAVQWTDGYLMLDADSGPMLQRVFDDNSKLFRVREARNVHIMGSFDELVLIRKITVRIPKKYTNTPCVAGVVFVFHETPTSEDMAKLRLYDDFTWDQYEAYVTMMRQQQMIPLPGDPVGFFDVGSPHFLSNVITVVPEFAIMGRVVVIKLLRCYNIHAMEDLADTIKRDEDSNSKERGFFNPVYLWCHKPHEEWITYPSDVEYNIESQYQAYCNGESMLCHGELTVNGKNVVLDFQRMVQYDPSPSAISLTSSCRIRRLVVPVELKVKLTTHHSMEVEYIGLYGLIGQAAQDAYSSWTLQYHKLTGSVATEASNGEIYRVLSEKASVYNFPSQSAKVTFYLLYGEIVVIIKRMGRWGRLKQYPGAPEAWVLLDSHQPSFYRIPRAQAAASATVPWLNDVFCVAPAGDVYKGKIVAQLPYHVNTTLVDVVNKLREVRGRCALSIVSNDLVQFFETNIGRNAYQSLMGIEIPKLMGRLDVIRHLNTRLVPYVMMLGIGSPFAMRNPNSLAGICTQAKGLLFLETKIAVWKKIWSESYSMERSSEVVSINRHIAFKVRATLTEHRSKLDLVNLKDTYASTVFCQLYEELRHTPPALLRRSDGKSWFTKFKGEPSIDDGGLYRETNATICYELNQSLIPLFVLCSNGKHEEGIDQNALVPNLACLQWVECCDWWTFVGVLMGIATQNLEEVFPISLARPVWKLLVGETLGPDDLGTFDSAAARTLAFLRDPYMDEAMFDASFPDLTFTCITDQDTEVEIVPNGKHRQVTYAMRHEYAKALEEWKLHQFDEAVQYLYRGLTSIVHAELLAMFTWKELELLVCGRPTLNIELLKKKTEYSPDMDNHDTLVLRFWRTLSSFTSEEQQQFLQFVWGRSRLPFSEVDFGTYTFKLVRHMSPGNPDDYLPVAHTCFFQLELPNYSSDAIMKAKLLYAMNHCTSIVDEEQAAQQRDIALWDS